MVVTAVGSLPELNQILERADANRLIIVDFYANWCGPCRMISPIFDEFSQQFGNATFLKVNTDQARDIVSRYGISAMPTFLFFKQNRLVDTVRGANQHGILQTIRKHYSGTPANPNAASDEEKKFLEQFVRYSDRPRKYYQDEVFKALARSVVPEEELIEKSQRADGTVDRIEFLRKLTSWFKTEFFTWFDGPTCPKCTLKCKTGGLSGTPTREERDEGGAERVEIFICEGCNNDLRFPRYNNPAKLLQTRTGRCGEWANCFCLILSAMNFEFRFILDTTDHVWAEVFLENRWIHVDPCENSIDKPLLYTRGWNKKLKYCIGYGIDHVADVTWRYVFDSKETVKSRNEVRQPVLENFLSKLNARQMDGQTDQRKKELKIRRACELLEMMSKEAENKKIGWEKLGDDLGGRITGSEEWRKARGELGDAPNQPKPLGEPIKLTETVENLLEFRYDVNKDQYSQNPVEGFISNAFECENIQRKVEQDWNMVYLCRNDGKEPGTISWHFDLKNIGKSIEKVEIRLAGIQAFEKAKAMAVVCLGDTCMRIPSSGVLTIEEPKELGVLKITATLSGGEGSIAFQQAQLFRTELKKSDESTTESLLVKIWTK